MKIIFLFFIYTSLIFSQGKYLSKESGLSAGFKYEGNNDYNQIGFAATYSLFGFIDLSYARSTFLNERNLSNYQNEYFFRAYFLKEKIPVFFSGSFGYISANSETELWKGFPLKTNTKGFAYEIGLHIKAAKEKKYPKLITSIIYRVFNSEEIIKTPNAAVSDNKIISSLKFEVAAVYYFSQIGIIFGPGFSL